jgi:hypothetical protein
VPCQLGSKLERWLQCVRCAKATWPGLFVRAVGSCERMGGGGPCRGRTCSRVPKNPNGRDSISDGRASPEGPARRPSFSDSIGRPGVCLPRKYPVKT